MTRAAPKQWRVVTFNSRTDREFATREEALDYITMNDDTGDWHVEPIAPDPAEAMHKRMVAELADSAILRFYTLRNEGKTDREAIEEIITTVLKCYREGIGQ